MSSMVSRSCCCSTYWRRHGILNSLELGGIKFDDLAALRANHVSVMLVFIVMFVMSAAVPESHFASQSRIGKQPQRSIDGRLADGGIFFADQAMEIVSRQVAFRAQEDFENKIALRGTLQAFLLNMLQENFLLFSHRLCAGPQVLFG